MTAQKSFTLNAISYPTVPKVQSEFQKAYDKGIPKSKFWEPTCEDSLNLIAQVPYCGFLCLSKDLQRW